MSVQSNNFLYASFVATALNWNAGVTVPIPDLPGSTAGISPALPTTGGAAQGTVFQFNIDLSQLPGVSYSLAGLPDGRPLPDVEAGVLPRWAFSIQNVDIYLYLSDQAFGLFVPINLQGPNGVTLPATISMNIDDSRGNLVGEVYAIPAQGSGTSSGLFVLLPYIDNTQTDQPSTKPTS